MKKLLLALAVALAGCSTLPPPPTPANTIFPIDTQGDYTHEPSHFQFPAQLAGFRRITLGRRGDEGQSLSAGYAGGPPECLVAMTFWVDPAPNSMPGTLGLPEAFAEGEREVMHAYPAAVKESEESQDNPQRPGRRAVYRIDVRQLELIVFAVDGWFLKYRVMYPAACAQQAARQAGGFFEAGGR
jgi:hypothetical protein